MLLATRLRVVQKNAKGTETTEALSCVQVPGGVIWHDSTFTSPSGAKLSHSKLELIDFHVVERAPAKDISLHGRLPRPLAQNCCIPRRPASPFLHCRVR
jgi:hypothetical protein